MEPIVSRLSAMDTAASIASKSVQEIKRELCIAAKMPTADIDSFIASSVPASYGK